MPRCICNGALTREIGRTANELIANCQRSRQWLVTGLYGAKDPVLDLWCQKVKGQGGRNVANLACPF